MAASEEIEAVRPRLFGLIDEDRIVRVQIPRPSPDLVERFLAISDLSSTVSDVLDELGIGGAVPGHNLQPIGENQRICGPAITIRYVPSGGSTGDHYARSDRPLLADRDLYAVGQAGDVAVFDCGGRADVSVLGGLSASWAKRLGLAGCVVDGGVRDIESIRAEGLAVWSRGRTPRTGRHRAEAIEINGCARVDQSQVSPGDLIVGDSTGLCVIPHDAVEPVLLACEAADAQERVVIDLVHSGASIREILAAKSAESW